MTGYSLKTWGAHPRCYTFAWQCNSTCGKNFWENGLGNSRAYGL